MRIRIFHVCLLLALMLGSPKAYGQEYGQDGFRSTFQPRTLKELVSVEIDVEQPNQKEDSIVFPMSKTLSSRVRATYTGVSRQIPKVKGDLIRKWVKLVWDEYSNPYVSEVLFIEGSVNYWLPILRDVSDYYKKVKRGDIVDLYVFRAGGIRKAGKWDWLILVYESEKSKD